MNLPLQLKKVLLNYLKLRSRVLQYVDCQLRFRSTSWFHSSGLSRVPHHELSRTLSYRKISLSFSENYRGSRRFKVQSLRKKLVFNFLLFARPLLCVWGHPKCKIFRDSKAYVVGIIPVMRFIVEDDLLTKISIAIAGCSRSNSATTSFLTRFLSTKHSFPNIHC